MIRMTSLPHAEGALRALDRHFTAIAHALTKLVTELSEAAASARRAQLAQLADELEGECDNLSIELGRVNTGLATVKQRLRAHETRVDIARRTAELAR